MGMYQTHSTAEESFTLDTKWLKDHGYLRGWKCGGITWTYGWNKNESSIGFSVDTLRSSPSIRFEYTITRWKNGEKKEMDYTFPLVPVPCNLGGIRWAFKCSLWRNGVYCGKTVYTLYRADSDWFGCRKCMKIVYESQRDSGSKYEFLGKILKAEKKHEKLFESMKKLTYKGRPTKKFIKVAKLSRKVPPVEQFEKIFNSTFR
jgi:hypothetical protein